MEFKTVGVHAEIALKKVQNDHAIQYDLNLICHYELCDSVEAGASTAEAVCADHSHRDDWKPVEKPSWRPDFLVYDCTERALMSERYWQRGNTIITLWNVIAEVHETLELHRFPFDRQITSVSIGITNGTFKSWSLDLNEMPSFLSGQPLDKDFHVIFEVILETWIVDWVKGSISETDISVDCGIERLCEFYVYNVAGFLFILTLAVNVTAVVPLEDIADRFSIAMTLMLAVVAFKFVIVSMIPPTSYITVLDAYILTTLAYIFATLVKDVVCRLVDASEETDYLLTVVWAGLWAVLHLLGYIAAMRGWFILDWDQVKEEQLEALTFNMDADTKMWNREKDEIEQDDSDDDIELVHGFS
eukprot:m.21906 g.21906  ORF g.21906 m.21906 type:complete len:359 (+) comp11178_c0_seq1:230-1306(+)